MENISKTQIRESQGLHMCQHWLLAADIISGSVLFILLFILLNQNKDRDHYYSKVCTDSRRLDRSESRE